MAAFAFAALACLPQALDYQLSQYYQGLNLYDLLQVPVCKMRIAVLFKEMLWHPHRDSLLEIHNLAGHGWLTMQCHGERRNVCVRCRVEASPSIECILPNDYCVGLETPLSCAAILNSANPEREFHSTDL